MTVASQGQQLRIEPLQPRQMKARTGLSEASVTDATHQARLPQHIGKKGIELGLLGARAQAHQRTDQRGQGQAARACEGLEVAWVTSPLGELRAVQVLGERSQQGLYEYTVLSS